MSKPSEVTRLLSRLRTPEAADRLVDRWIADLMGRRLDEVAPPARVAEWVHRLTTAATGSDAMHARIVTGIQEELSRASTEKKTLRELAPAEVSALARDLAARPHSPDRAMVLAVLDREPMRKLIRALLVDVLVEFGRRIASLASPLTGSRVGRGLGALGAIAGAVGSGVVGAVSGELERQVEKRAADFADLGISRVLQRLADLASDPSLARDQSELRAALVEGVLDLKLSDLAADLRKQDLVAIAGLVRSTLRANAAKPELQKTLVDYLERTVARELPRPIGEVLTELGLRVEVEAILREVLAPRARSFDWAAWIESELHP